VIELGLVQIDLVELVISQRVLAFGAEWSNESVPPSMNL
jgi:hypothetical protein